MQFECKSVIWNWCENPLPFNIFLISFRFRTVWDVSDCSICSYRVLDIHFRSINCLLSKWFRTTQVRRYLFLIALSLQQKKSSLQYFVTVASQLNLRKSFSTQCLTTTSNSAQPHSTHVHICKHISTLFDFVPIVMERTISMSSGYISDHMSKTWA